MKAISIAQANGSLAKIRVKCNQKEERKKMQTTTAASSSLLYGHSARRLLH